MDLLLGSKLPATERTGSAGLQAGCRVDLPVHAALYTNRKKSYTTLVIAGMRRIDATVPQLSRSAPANTIAHFTTAGSDAGRSAYCSQFTNA